MPELPEVETTVRGLVPVLRGRWLVSVEARRADLRYAFPPDLRQRLTGLVWSRQNAETLTYPERTFDTYTIAFGIRNVTHIDKALAEAHRVLKFGGRFFCLEFSTTEWPGFRDAYDFYSHKLVPRLGQAIAGDAESYRYLIESIRRFPTMPQFEAMIREAGFVRTRVEPIMGGLVAIHSGWKA